MSLAIVLAFMPLHRVKVYLMIVAVAHSYTEAVIL